MKPRGLVIVATSQLCRTIRDTTWRGEWIYMPVDACQSSVHPPASASACIGWCVWKCLPTRGYMRSHAGTHTSTHTDTHTWRCIHTHLRAYARTLVWTYIYTHLYTDTYQLPHTRTWMLEHTRAYSHKRAHARTRTRILIWFSDLKTLCSSIMSI